MPRIKKILNAAKDAPCVRCGRDGETRACHFNGTYQHQYGKGRGIKGHDMATAELCHTCDQIFTEGSTNGFLSKDDRDAQFLHLITMTNIRRFERGVFKCD